MSRSTDDVAISVGLRPEKLDEACSEAMFVSLASSLDPWRLIFCGLLTNVELNDVEEENRTGQERRVACLRRWEAKNGGRATYRVLVQALVNNERVSQAEEMCRRLAEADRAPPLTPPPSTSPQPTTSTISTPLQATPTPSPVRTVGEPSCGLDVQIDELDQQYIKLERLTLKAIKDRKVPIDEVLDWVRFPPTRLRSQFAGFLKSNAELLSSTKSVDGLFSILSSYCNLFHPDLLQHIVNQIEVQALKAQMDRYIANLHHFRVHTTLGDFMDKWIGDIPAGYTEFVLELGEKWRERTVEDLEQFRVKISRINSFGGGYMPMLKTAKSSSIIVVLALPQPLFPLNFVHKDIRDFCREHDVLRVTVDGKCPLDMIKLVEYERQLIQLCSQGGEVDNLSRILSQPGVDPNIFDEEGRTPLWLASGRGFVEFVKVLLKYGADVNLPTNDVNEFGESPLINAAYYGHTSTCLVLLDHGAKIDFQQKEGASSLIFACQEEHLDVVKLLLSRGASVDLPDDGATPLYSASQNGHTSIVDYLIEKGATIDKPDQDGLTPLYVASSHGHPTVVELLLDKGATVDLPAKDGVTPLMIASQEGHLEVAMALVNKGANVNHQKETGWCALHSASAHGQPQVVEFLNQKGATVNLRTEKGATALAVASYNGHEDIVGQLLAVQADPDIPTKDGLTALILATQGGHLGVVSALLQGGANPNITQKDSGWGALHFSAKEGKTEVAKLLLDHGADAQLKDKTGVTPYQLAKLHHNEDICSMLNNYYNTTDEGTVTEEQEKQVKSFSRRIRGVFRSLKATLLSSRTEKEQKQKSIRKVATSESDKERVTVPALVKS